MIRIDPSSRKTICDQIVEGIEKWVLYGILHEGDRLPSVRTLAMDLGVNPGTVAKAYRLLEERGILRSVAAKGCFVAETSDGLLRLRQEWEKDFFALLQKAVRLGIGPEEISALAAAWFRRGAESPPRGPKGGEFEENERGADHGRSEKPDENV